LNENHFDLPETRLASTTETGERVYLYPAKVKGFFRKWRTVLYHILIVIFLVLPWIKINGHPLILLDIPNRKFAIFGLLFWGHEAPILFLVLLSFIVGITLITTALGRIWCGWACPQTVFIDGWFRAIEEFIEGSGMTRKRYEKKPLSLQKVFKKSVKWILFLALSLVITHSFLAYFAGADAVLDMIQHAPSDNMTSFLVILFSTGIILFNFGWFREQFCIIACPYGRFQSVVMDEDSLVVAYDTKRGEPRKKDYKDTDAEGDCINCYRCVQVCPTGVDIRRGTQLECIMCTACIDACDTVMTKINKPTGLIRYDTENGINRKKKRVIRPRLIIYIVLFLTIISALTVAIHRREMVSTYTFRSTNPPYQLIENARVMNQFSITVQNQYFVPIKVAYSIEDPDVELISPTLDIELNPGEKKTQILFIRLPLSRLSEGKLTLPLLQTVEKEGDSTTSTKEVTIIGPRSK